MYHVTGYYQVQQTETITIGRYQPVQTSEQRWQVASVEIGYYPTVEEARSAAAGWQAQYAGDLQAATTIQDTDETPTATPHRTARHVTPAAQPATWSLAHPRPHGLTTAQLLHAWQLDSVPVRSDLITFIRPDDHRIRVAGKTLRQLLTLHKDAVWTWSLPNHDYDGSAISPSSVNVITAKAHTYLELTVCTPDTPRPATIHLVDNAYAKGRTRFVLLPAQQPAPLPEVSPINPRAYQQASLFG